MTEINSSYLNVRAKSQNLKEIQTQNCNNVSKINLEQILNNDSFTKKEENNKKNFFIPGIAAAAVITAVGAFFAISRSKSFQLKDIEFSQGIAFLPNKEKFSGKVKDKLKNGDKIVLEYIDGVLQKSTRKGENAFEKTYKTLSGEKIVTTLKDGKTTEVNLTKLNNEAKESQNKIKKLLKNNSSLSYEDFKRQADDIKYKNSEQNKQIEKIAKKKKDEVIAEQNECDTALNAAKIEENGESEATIKPIEDNSKVQNDFQENLNNDKLIQVQGDYDAELLKFKIEISEMAEDELLELQKKLLQEQTKIIDKAQAIAKEKNCDKIVLHEQFELLSEEEKLTYKFLNDKNVCIQSELAERKKEFLENLLFRDGDKKVAAQKSEKYTTSDEYNALNAYRYLGSELNSSLRGEDAFDVDINPDIIDEVFKKAPALKREAVVYRGVWDSISEKNYPFVSRNKKFIDSIKEGFVMENPAYTSAARYSNFDHCLRYAQEPLLSNGYLMRIKLPEGTKGILHGEFEYILPRNSKIEVEKINTIDGVKIADCKYILPQ